MNRRNFLFTAGATMATAVIPQPAEAKVVGVDWGAAEGDKGCAYNDDLMRICRSLNPVEFFTAFFNAPGRAGLIECYATAQRPVTITDPAPWAVTALPGNGATIPRLLVTTVPCVPWWIRKHLADALPTSVMYGRHVDAHEVPGDTNIHWTVGAYYAEARFGLPDGTGFGFVLGELPSPVCQFPRALKHRGESVGKEPDFWLHVRGNFVQEYLQSPTLWGGKPDSLMHSETAHEVHPLIQVDI